MLDLLKKTKVKKFRNLEMITVCDLTSNHLGISDACPPLGCAPWFQSSTCFLKKSRSQHDSSHSYFCSFTKSKRLHFQFFSVSLKIFSGVSGKMHVSKASHMFAFYARFSKTLPRFRKKSRESDVWIRIWKLY